MPGPRASKRKEGPSPWPKTRTRRHTGWRRGEGNPGHPRACMRAQHGPGQQPRSEGVHPADGLVLGTRGSRVGGPAAAVTDPSGESSHTHLCLSQIQHL